MYESMYGNSDKSVLINTFRCYAEIANTKLKYYFDKGDYEGMKDERTHILERYNWH